MSSSRSWCHYFGIPLGFPWGATDALLCPQFFDRNFKWCDLSWSTTKNQIHYSFVMYSLCNIIYYKVQICTHKNIFRGFDAFEYSFAVIFVCDFALVLTKWLCQLLALSLRILPMCHIFTSKKNTHYTQGLLYLTWSISYKRMHSLFIDRVIHKVI